MRRAFAAFLLLLSACNRADDQLPDDLTTAEGTAPIAEDNVANEVEPDPLPPSPAEVPADEALANQQALAPVTDPLAPAPASDPSFDCADARNRVERHICQVPELGALDRQVSETFDRAMDDASPDQQERLRALGRRYLEDRDRCRDDYCIRQAYRWYRRDIQTLMGWPSPL